MTYPLPDCYMSCSFTGLCYVQVPLQTWPITVRNCTVGEVQPTNDTCMACPATTYSFTPSAAQCIAPCPANSNCSGGATLVPSLGYWHSAPNSTYMAACPNSDACQGDRSVLLACQTAGYMPLTTSGQLQVKLSVQSANHACCCFFPLFFLQS